MITTQKLRKEKEQVVKDLQKMSGKGEWKTKTSEQVAVVTKSNYTFTEIARKTLSLSKDIQNIMKKNKDLKDIDSSIAKHTQNTL